MAARQLEQILYSITAVLLFPEFNKNNTIFTVTQNDTVDLIELISEIKTLSLIFSRIVVIFIYLLLTKYSMD